MKPPVNIEKGNRFCFCHFSQKSNLVKKQVSNY